MQIVIQVTGPGQLQVQWNKSKPFEALAMLDAARQAIQNDAAKTEAQQGVTLAPAEALGQINRLTGNGIGKG